MTDKTSSLTFDETMQQIIARSIDSAFGRVDGLPTEVADRLRMVYREFIPVYLEIIRLRDSRSKDWLPKVIVPDPEVVEDMLHFFSDYQDLTRRFKRMNRQVKKLLNIDRQADPHRFERCVAEIVSNNRDSSIMDAIVDQSGH